MARVAISSIIKTSVVTAFTLATALIWRDVIIEAIEFFVPPKEELFYKFLAAILSTIIVIIAIYVFLKTEPRAEIVIKRLRRRK